MNQECSIVRDLLPLYTENMVSPETAQYIEAHLAHCPACRETRSRYPEAAAPAAQTDAVPIRTLRKKWNRKKAALICISVCVTVILMLCALLIVDHTVYPEKLMVNDTVYAQAGKTVTELPEGSRELGYLRSILHRNTGDPYDNFMAVNVDAKYGGCPIYQSGADENIVYLEDFSGFFIPFVISRPAIP